MVFSFRSHPWGLRNKWNTSHDTGTSCPLAGYHWRSRRGYRSASASQTELEGRRQYLIAIVRPWPGANSQNMGFSSNGLPPWAAAGKLNPQAPRLHEAAARVPLSWWSGVESSLSQISSGYIPRKRCRASPQSDNRQETHQSWARNTCCCRWPSIYVCLRSLGSARRNPAAHSQLFQLVAHRSTASLAAL